MITGFYVVNLTRVLTRDVWTVSRVKTRDTFTEGCKNKKNPSSESETDVFLYLKY